MNNYSQLFDTFCKLNWIKKHTCRISFRKMLFYRSFNFLIDFKNVLSTDTLNSTVSICNICETKYRNIYRISKAKIYVYIWP